MACTIIIVVVGTAILTKVQRRCFLDLWGLETNRFIPGTKTTAVNRPLAWFRGILGADCSGSLGGCGRACLFCSRRSVDHAQGRKLFPLESATKIINSSNGLYINKYLSGFVFFVTSRFLSFSGPYFNTFTGDVQRVRIVLGGIARHDSGGDD
jgi:hypothetical protein